MPEPTANIAIIDYGMGNLFSVARACELAGMSPTITSDPSQVSAAEAMVLPGVGAFGDAMDGLKRQGLDQAILSGARQGKPLLGICLGLQLLFERSFEFGCHDGLGLIAGDVVSMGSPKEGAVSLKVPHVGWDSIALAPGLHGVSQIPPSDDVLSGIQQGQSFYFVHSFIVRPADRKVITAESSYGDLTFCSAVQDRNIAGVQFHPERSGMAGLAIYRNFASLVRARVPGVPAS